jgi:hypothetical protein
VTKKDKEKNNFDIFEFNIIDLLLQLKEIIDRGEGRYKYAKIITFSLMVYPYYVASKIRSYIFKCDHVYNFSVKNLYNSCRKSLAFYNNFPIEMVVDYDLKNHFKLSKFICNLAICVQRRESLRHGFSAYRRARHFCDKSITPESGEYYVILSGGKIYRLPVNASPECISDFVVSLTKDNLFDSLRVEGVRGFTLCSAMVRSSWAKIENLLNNNDAKKLSLLRGSGFVLCLDMERNVKPYFDKILDNRFFDKAIQVCVDLDTGKLKFIFEHATFDGAGAAKILLDLKSDMASIDKKLIVSNERAEMECEIQVFSNIIESDVTHLLYSNEINILREVKSKYIEEEVVIPLVCRGEKYQDYLVQFAINSAYQEIFGVCPTVFEPVVVTRPKERTLDFIDSTIFFKDAVGGQKEYDTLIERLEEYKVQHRKRVIRSKEGRGLLSNLMMITTFSCLGQRFNAVIQLIIETLVVSLSSDFRSLYSRNLMASNGAINKCVSMFGTIIHREDMIGVGYVIHEECINLSINSNSLLKNNNFNNFVLSLQKKLIDLDGVRIRCLEGEDE